MYLKFIIAAPAVILYLFLYWRRLKEDYPQQSIFSTAFFMLIGIVIFSIISAYFRESWWFWFAVAGALIGFLLAVLKFGLKITENLDASFLALNTLAVASYFYLGSINGNFSAYLLVLLHLVLYLLFWVFDENYKKFRWYRSGKIGFAGFMTLGIYFLSRSLIALYYPDMISFVGEIDAIVSGVLAFISFLGLYNLSRQTN